MYLPFWHALQLAHFPSHKCVYENVGFHSRTQSKASLHPKHVGPKEMDHVHEKRVYIVNDIQLDPTNSNSAVSNSSLFELLIRGRDKT